MSSTKLFVIGCVATRLLLVHAGYQVGLESNDSYDSVTEVVFAVDGRFYREIASECYAYTPYLPSNVAFFPLFPISGRLLGHALGTDAGLIFVSYACSILGIVLFSLYEKKRIGHPLLFGTLAFAVYPQSLYCFSAYSEPLFILVLVAFLYCITTGSHHRWTAFLCGLATGIRPVGIALLPAQLIYAWRKSGKHRVLNTTLSMVVSCSGLLVYMTYLQIRFGDAFCFAKTQQFYLMRPHVTLFARMRLLLTGEPIWGHYLSDPPRWSLFHDVPWWSSYSFFNPLFFCLALTAICFGTWKKILNVYEVVISFGLLAIPYVTRAYEMNMSSQGRFTLVIVPMFLVFARFLDRSNTWIKVSAIGASSLLLFLFSLLRACRLSVF